MAQWILEDSDWNAYKCSECGETWNFTDGTPQENNANFCPRCGVRLVIVPFAD